MTFYKIAKKDELNPLNLSAETISKSSFPTNIITSFYLAEGSLVKSSRPHLWVYVGKFMKPAEYKTKNKSNRPCVPRQCTVSNALLSSISADYAKTLQDDDVRC